MSTAAVERWRAVASHAAVQELLLVMFLPHLLGLVSLLAASGSLHSSAGVVQLGVLVLNGPATFSITLCRIDVSQQTATGIAAAIGLVLVPATAVVAGLAPTLALVVPEAVSYSIAGLIVATLAVSLGTEWYDDVAPSVRVIAALLVGILLLVASLRVLAGDVVFAVVFDWSLFWRGGAAGAVGVCVVALPLLARKHIRHRVDIQRLRFGFACALALLALELAQVVEGTPSLYLTGCAVLLATEHASSPKGE